MSELRRFRATDLFTFNPINLDRLTETYNLSFYLSYMATWPDLFLVQHAPGSTTISGPTTGGVSSGSATVRSSSGSTTRGSSSGSTNGGFSSHEAPAAHEVPAAGRMMGYLMGKLEGRGTDWHSHVTAITVSPEYRRLGVARGMMQGFELSSDQYGPQPEDPP